MTPVSRLLIPLVALAALGACDREKPAAATASAQGEILEGSVSDAMLPLGTVRSEAPLAPRSETTGQDDSPGRSRSAARDRDDEPAAAAEPAADPAPAAEEEATPAEE